ncbi:chorismate mutase [Fomitiporia mediterranea MF3/22]|uniref:chorismate mutase n=1 Tax=Fomitiporia mediterranea (strain MF3/22) TaxID=694068 RepID=UPI0004408003|nr:chorismate mutase [Fomitiporia mediterranea MF3/22]EJC98451.1 chorismate mutase [Fomitiporia mediterranea MF3/22]
MQQNFLRGDPLSLDRIRSTLIRLEDTIIFGLIERAQFAHNPKIYEAGGVPELKERVGFEGSWLDWFLAEIEGFHAKARRYTSPDEYPFTPIESLPQPLLAPLSYPKLLHPNTVNVNPSLKSLYIRSIVPRITSSATRALAALRRAQGITGDPEREDDGNYGSSATLDVEILQALSKRVHYGKFVSESKFRANPGAFVSLIRKEDREGLVGLIEKKEVERRLLLRVRNKARVYGQEVDADGNPVGPVSPVNGNVATPNGNGEGKIDVEGVVELYEHYIIPLTKEVEVDYLLQRLDGLSEEEVEELCKSKKQ